MRLTQLPLASLPSFKGLFFASPLSLAPLFNDDAALALHARKSVGSASACWRKARSTPCAAAAAADGNDDASAALFFEVADGIAAIADCKREGKNTN
jgi:hypothetical protein